MIQKPEFTLIEQTLKEAISSGDLVKIENAIEASIGYLKDSVEEKHVLYCLEKGKNSLTTERKTHYCKRALSLMHGEDSLPYSDLVPSRWMNYPEVKTESLWIMKNRKRDDFHDASYWGNFVPQIPEQLITRYSREGEVVLDPFLGMGTTVAEARRLNRKVIGIELSGEVSEKAKTKLSSAGLMGNSVRIVCGDSSTVTAEEIFGEWDRKVDLIIMHPPYHDIITFSDNPQDLANASDVEQFLVRLEEVLVNVGRFLHAGRFLALVIGDKYSGGEWIPLGFRSMQAVQANNYLLKSIVVKNYEGTRGKRMQENLWKYRALKGGYYTFRHEYIFIFMKK